MKMNQIKPNHSSLFNVLLAVAEVFAAGDPQSVFAMAHQRQRLGASVFIALVLCLPCLAPAIAAPGSWTRKADMPAQPVPRLRAWWTESFT